MFDFFVYYIQWNVHKGQDHMCKTRFFKFKESQVVLNVLCMFVVEQSDITAADFAE